MAGVVYVDRQSASSLMYESMSEQFSDFISEVNNRTMDLLGDVSRRFVDRVSRFRDRVGYERISRIKERADRVYQRTLGDYDFDALLDIDALRTARPRMRRYLMADPGLRKLYRQRKISGWSRAVTDDESIPVEQVAEYQHVIDGVLVGDYYTEYSSEELDNLRLYDKLSLVDRQNIMLSWESMRNYIDYDKLDPSSEYGARID